jgi:hypothetical protein
MRIFFCSGCVTLFGFSFNAATVSDALTSNGAEIISPQVSNKDGLMSWPNEFDSPWLAENIFQAPGDVERSGSNAKSSLCTTSPEIFSVYRKCKIKKLKNIVEITSSKIILFQPKPQGLLYENFSHNERKIS